MRHSSSKNDLSEFVCLLTEHQSVIRNYITQLIPNASDVRDVLQITNVALWERRHDFTFGTNFKAWALAVARYRAMEYRKKLQKDHMLVFDDDLLDTLHEEFDADLEETEQKKIALELCLGKLKPRDLNLISARYDQRIPLADYAKSDGRTEGSLRVTLNRLRSLLKNCIDQQLLVNPSSSSL